MSAQKYYTEFKVTTMPRTAAANPLITPINLGDVLLHSVQLRIPSGHSGATGIAIRLPTVSIIPWGDLTTWVVGDDDRLDFEYGQEVGSGLMVATYNTGSFEHSHYLRFVNTPISAAIATPTLVTIGAIT